jgi:tetratricopeptide (TPR) repeat protein
MDSTTATSTTSVIAPLVGRQHELDELNQILDRAIQYETPQVVTLVGSPGVGKTRLLGHWIDDVARRHPDLRVFISAATPDAPSYDLFTRLLERRFRLRDAHDAGEAFRAEVEEVLLDRRLTEVLHFLGSFVGINVPDNPFIKALEEAPQQHDQIARTVLRRFLEMDAQQSPMVLVLEDLDQADADSLSLFRELAESLEGAPLVFVGTLEPALFVEQPDFCQIEAEHTQIDLPPLEQGESEALLRKLLGRLDEVPPDLLETAVDMTGGNPFFMEELVRVMIANGTIQSEEERWTIDEERAEEAELPVSVEEAVHARISSLSPAERDVLEKAAALGSVFWLEALICFSRLQREVAEKADLWLADVEHQTIREILDELRERDFILEIPDSSIPGVTEYAFKHNMERELISKMISGGKMEQYHLFAAQWLETRLQDRSESQLEYVGQHYLQGGNHRRAAFCFVHAGDKARARYANEQAATYYKRGLGVLGLDDVLAKIEALHNLGDVCTVLGRNEEALQHFTEMLHNAWLLDHMAKGGAAHRRIGRIYRTLGEYERALSHLNSAARLFEQADDARGVAATLDDVGQVAWLKGEYQQALEFHRRALTIKREIGNPRSIAVALNNIGTVHQNSGSFKAALECFTEALEIRKEVGDQVGVVDSLLHLGTACRAQSDYTRAFELWNQALSRAREIGDRLQEAYLLIYLGEAQTQLGKFGEAEALLAEATVLARDLGDRRLKGDSCRTRAELKLATGELEDAEREAQLAHDIATKLGLRPEMGAALRTMAEVVAAHEINDERKARATGLFERAIETFAELGDDLELARTFASLADYMDSCGQWQDADHFRSSADEIFARLKGAVGEP